MTSTDNKTDKRGAILEATLELIAENGFHQSPTSKIAEKAGVGVGSIYRYFKDKDELIHEVFRENAETMSKAILRDHDPGKPMREQFIRLCLNMFHFMVENPKIFAFNEQYFNSPYGDSHKGERTASDKTKTAAKGRLPLFDLFDKARDQQIVKDLPSPVLGALIMGPIILLIHDIFSGLFVLEADMVRRTVEACWDAVKR